MQFVYTCLILSNFAAKTQVSYPYLYLGIMEISFMKCYTDSAVVKYVLFCERVAM